MKSSLSFAKIWFGLSLLALAFVYGFASHAWGLFPRTYVEQAWRQARTLSDDGTGAPGYPKHYDREGARTPLPNEVEAELTLVTSGWNESDGLKYGAKLIDRQGDVLHEWLFNKGELLPDTLDVKGNPEAASITNAQVLPSGDLIGILAYVGMVRLDACGNVLWALSEGIHHWGERAEDGTFWVPGVSRERQNSSERYPDGYPGIDKPVWLDRILNVSEDGEVMEDIYVLDVMYENGLERYIPKMMVGTWPSQGEVPDDITHMNDVEPLDSSIADEYPLFDAGDLLVSLRHPNLVFVFDPKTLNVKWHASDPFVYQHDPDFIGDGWIGILNNNRDLTGDGSMLGDSEIVMMQPHTDSVRVLFPTEQSEPFHTFHRGTWQKLDNGNMLLAETSKGRIVEVTPDGRTAWEWVHESPESDDSKVLPAGDADRPNLTRNDVAPWSCSSVDSLSTSNQGK